MIQKQALGDLRMIPIDRIEVLNPRDRNKQVFEQIVVNGCPETHFSGF